MLSQKLHLKIQKYLQILQKYTDRFWYSPLIAFLAALDNLLIVIPTDGILISSTMLIPKRWFLYALAISIGSTLGAIALSAIVEFHGLPWILQMYPGIESSKTWEWSVLFFDKYGLLLVFALAATPLMQQPGIILASLANTPLAKLAVVVFAGRFLKYLVMAYVASHAPRLLKKMWGLSSELKDAGITVKES